MSAREFGTCKFKSNRFKINKNLRKFETNGENTEEPDFFLAPHSARSLDLGISQEEQSKDPTIFYYPNHKRRRSED
jgi:hypothetical protein